MFRVIYPMIAVFMVFSCVAAYAGGDASKGKEKSSACSSCHGASGEGMASNPALAGLEEGYIIEQLNAYKSGAREHMMMKMATKILSDDDIANLAAFYASLGK